ncbi:MAG: hypothetical protein AAFR52_16240 [Pseudomonadota bacterium]
MTMVGAGVLVFSALGLPFGVGAVPLVFDTPAQTRFDAPATGSATISDTAVTTYASDFIRFRDVGDLDGTQVFARVTIETLKPDTRFDDAAVTPDLGFLPNFEAGGGEPNGDLGLLYEGVGTDGAVENGIVARIEFVQRISPGPRDVNFAPVTLPEIEIAVYDVDGESQGPGGSLSQTEFFRAYRADGLAGYRVEAGGAGVTATRLSDSVLFEGQGVDGEEADISGAAILRYVETSAITLDFGSVQFAGPTINGVFTGIDGDLSLFPGGFGFTDERPAAVPLPAGGWLLATALVMMAARSRP